MFLRDNISVDMATSIPISEVERTAEAMQW